MKNWKIMIGFCMVLTLTLITGCTGNGSGEDTTKKETEKTTQTEASSSADTEVTIRDCEIYAPDENAETLISGTAKLGEVNEKTLLREMKTMGTVPDSVEIKSCKKDGTTLTVDFNTAFGNYLKKMGSSSEYMTVQAVVKTLCRNLDAQTMKFTVDGKVLETGHDRYDYAVKIEK